jgi:transcriptional regulator with XRE-family HTH domain
MTRDSAAAFGRILRRRRHAVGVSQEELAHRAELHRTFVSMLERGERNPSLEVIRKLASALGTTAGSLVTETDEEMGERSDART